MPEMYTETAELTDAIEENGPNRWGIAAVLSMATLVAFGLRYYQADIPFHTGDFAALPYKVTHQHGWEWIAEHKYGPVLPLVVLAFAKAVIAADGVMNETMWRMPGIAVGTALVPMTYLLLRRLGGGMWAAVMAAFLAAVLPPFVSDARYSYSYETVALFLAAATLWAWLRDLDRPTWFNRWMAGGLLAAYLMSHLVIQAVPPLLFVAALLACGFRDGLRRLVRPATAVPLILAAICALFAWLQFGGGILGRVNRHVDAGTLNPGASTLIDETRFWNEHMGPIWAGFCAVSIAVGLLLLARRDRRGLPAVWVLLYLVPLLTVADIHKIARPTEYHIQSTYAACLAGCLMLGMAAEGARAWQAAGRRLLTRAVVGYGFVICALQLFGAVSDHFTPYRWPRLAGTVDYGAAVPDPGSKAAGWYVRKHVPADAVVYVTHTLTGMEYPCATYYTGRHVAATEDVTHEQQCRLIDAVRDSVDVAIVEPAFLPRFVDDGAFDVAARIMRGDETALYAVARKGYAVPNMNVDVKTANAEYDREFRLMGVPISVPRVDRTGAVNQRILALLRAERQGAALAAVHVGEE